jgi:hypothetical protein
MAAAAGGGGAVVNWGAAETEERTEEQILSCPSESNPPIDAKSGDAKSSDAHLGGAKSGGAKSSRARSSDAKSSLGLRVLLSTSQAGLAVEFCFPIWVKNELGIDLLCTPVGVSAAAPTLLPAGGRCIPLHWPGLGPLPELYVHHAATGRAHASGEKTKPAAGSETTQLPMVSGGADAAFVPTGELIDAADEDSLLQERSTLSLPSPDPPDTPAPLL